MLGVVVSDVEMRSSGDRKQKVKEDQHGLVSGTYRKDKKIIIIIIIL